MANSNPKNGKTMPVKSSFSFENLLPPYGPHQIRWIAVVCCIFLFLLTVASKKESTPKKNISENAKKVEISVLVEDRNLKKDINPNLAKFEPENGCFLGAYIDLSDDVKNIYRDMTGKVRKYPYEFEKMVGKPHAMYFFYLGYGQDLPLDWIRYLTSKGKIVHIALEPNNGLDKVVDNAYLNQLVDDLRLSGAVIFLRFASEMNGNWVNYHGNPKLYKEKWRLITNKIRERAPNVAMVWCPYATPMGNVDLYYPGDEYVDWVGVNMYNVTYFDQNENMPATHIKPADLLNGIYNKYSARKPIMIGEYATTHYSALENQFLQTFAITNLKALYGKLKSDYPRVKAINYFNVDNLKMAHRMNNNYAVTHDPEVLKVYKELISDPYFLSSFFDQKVGGETLLPKPLVPGAVFSGRKRIISYVQNGSPSDSLRIKIDETIVREVTGVRQWATTIDFDQFSPGNYNLKLESFGSNGEITAQKLVPITIASSGLSK